METRITARRADLSDRIRADLEQSVSKLGRYYDGIHDAHIVLDESADPAGKRAEVKVNVSRRTLTATDAAPTYVEAVSGCVRQLRRQVLRYKQSVRDTSKVVHR